ncbi:MAG: hypothetical protein AAF490_12950 [Chloroflexota bacterium]
MSRKAAVVGRVVCLILGILFLIGCRIEPPEIGKSLNLEATAVYLLPDDELEFIGHFEGRGAEIVHDSQQISQFSLLQILYVHPDSVKAIESQLRDIYENEVMIVLIDTPISELLTAVNISTNRFSDMIPEVYEDETRVTFAAIQEIRSENTHSQSMLHDFTQRDNVRHLIIQVEISNLLASEE